ncbi:BQ5605_C005g03598 [Microbotryum silenes-dioicae]|uniref:BQ5605_C005g03598 protein n=1 Tax=Microbotryum silenes-dioicae TaxID=796604 RepID=A0A2X0PCZ0_9BASI|nr:BQ5605_C005g03598 [Microbotryum silenes-dioicae]
MPPSPRTIFYRPTAKEAEATLDSQFRRYVNKKRGLHLGDYWELHAWSLEDLNEFWTDMWDFTGIVGEKEKLLFDSSQPMDRVNPRLIQAKMNYAENTLMAHSNARSKTAKAIISVAEPSVPSSSPKYLESTHLRTMTYEELYQEVRKLAHSLKAMGVVAGDRVVAFSPSNVEVIVMTLAAASLGAVWSSCPSEFGVKAVLERFTQIEPKVLITGDHYRYNGKSIDVIPKLLELLEGLPTVMHVVMVGQLEKDRISKVPFPKNTHGRSWAHYHEVIKAGEGAPAEIQFTRMDAMAPIFVLYSSGTTGKPKAIVHTIGGMVLSQKMTNSCHNNMSADAVFLQFSTLGWMMWNYALSTLMNGCTMIAYDGSPLAPLGILFSLVDEYKCTHLGISPRFLQTLDNNNYLPKEHHSLKSLKVIATAGSVLKAELYDWVRDNVGPKVFINNGTGGTDICNLFVGGVPSLPVYHAEIQAPGLGMDLHALDDNGKPIIDAQGEMCILKPFPNMPLGFWNDEGDKRYRASYFETYKNPICWTQGDWIELHSVTGGCTVFGRSDGVLNPAGVRFGSAELYSVVEEMRDIVEDCIAVGQKLPDGDERVVLFVLPKQGNLTPELRKRINDNVRTQRSTRHVPAVMIHCPKIPYTGNGKRLEIPVKKLVNGAKYESLNLSSAEDPECLKFFINHPELELKVKAKL